VNEQPTLEEIWARTASYLRAQGEKYSFVELWPRVVRARLDLVDALDGVSEEQSSFRPAEDEWTIGEIAAHILASSQAARRIVQALVRGEHDGGEGVEAGLVPPDRPLSALRAALVEDGLAWSALTPTLPERPPLEPVTRHFMFGDLHARAWYLFQRAHDLDHAGQIAKVKEAPGYPAE
jgi:hypothetical protein